MKIYQTRASSIKGRDFKAVHDMAFDFYEKIRKKSKRKPYIRSAYFQKEKIFLHFYWEHVFQKTNWRDRLRRVKYFIAAIELLRNSKRDPDRKHDPNNPKEILYRFAGKTSNNEMFFIQIKEFTKKKNQKYLISIFPQ